MMVSGNRRHWGRIGCFRAALFLALAVAVLLGPTMAFSASNSDKPIKIGVIYAMTGKAATGNILALTGVRTAAKEINEYGGVLGRKIELLEFDNKSTPEGSKAAAEQAVQANVTAIVGPAWSSHAFAVAPVAQAAGIPMISSSATHPGVTKIGNYIFRACYVDVFQGKVLATFVRRDLKGDSVVTMVDPNDEYSVGLSNEFKRQFRELGGMIMNELTYDPKAKNFKDLVTATAKDDPQFAFIPGHDESAQIALELQQAGLRALAVGGGWMGFQTIFQTWRR